jgi:ribonucleoside-diphosphate reductase alpha chain
MIIDKSRDDLLPAFAKATMDGQFCLPGESYQQAFARAATAFSGGDEKLAQRLYDYASKQWFAFATPLLANGGTERGQPISCFLNYIDDSIEGLCENFNENAYLSVNGGGIGTYWGHVRSIGEQTSRGVETPGVMPFMHVQDAQVLAYHQGATRRGAAATYMDVSHPEIYEFIAMRSSTGGDVHRKNENLHHGVCITDAFMVAVENDEPFDLIDPHSKAVRATVSARDLWIKLLQQRMKLGEPYLFFVDTANRDLPSALREKGLYIHHSNLCTEITLPTNKDRTAVCCLSSLNLATYDEWAEHAEELISDLVTMLDNALTVFTEKANKAVWRAVASVEAERSIGLGTLGFHTLLQKRGCAMDSQEAEGLNEFIYSTIKMYALKQTKKLAQMRGEPSDLRGTGLRNAHLLAVAPNATSSIICGGVSPSVEPLAANIFTQKTKAGSFEVKNPVLVELLAQLGQNTDEVWSSIALNKGSVQHLGFLTDHQKNVFRTATEIDAGVLIDLAAQRQVSICQAQSINLFMPADVTTRELHKTHFDAWKKGLKSLYYLRSNSVKATSVGVQAPVAACSLDQGCKACEG